MLTTISPNQFTDYTFTGLAVAATIILCWAGLISTGLSFAFPGHGSVFGAVIWILLSTFAYTGLFITAHDAMHGLVSPKYTRLNHAIGALALALFAAMPYKTLLRAHGHHHDTPSSHDDPDYHEGGGYLRWYLGFVFEYATWTQFVVMAIIFNLLHHLLGVSLPVLWLFWILPQILSTLQLFTFGTFLPHRSGDYEGDGPTRTRTLHYPAWLSLLTCYHFGYHYEHHAWPFVPWWRLPEAYRIRKASFAKSSSP